MWPTGQPYLPRVRPLSCCLRAERYAAVGRAPLCPMPPVPPMLSWALRPEDPFLAPGILPPPSQPWVAAACRLHSAPCHAW